jgi:hypothetical protein
MKPFPCFCVDCKYSRHTAESTSLDCIHPRVLAKESYSLGSEFSRNEGVSCPIERDKKLFSACGIKGKLWEQV